MAASAFYIWVAAICLLRGYLLVTRFGFKLGKATGPTLLLTATYHFFLGSNYEDCCRGLYRTTSNKLSKQTKPSGLAAQPAIPVVHGDRRRAISLAWVGQEADKGFGQYYQ